MNHPMTMIEVDQHTAAILQRLKAKAEATGLTLAALLQPLTEETNGDRPAQPARNEAMFEVLQRSAERLKNVPITSTTEETLTLLHAARNGEMWGYEPTE